MRIEKVRSFTTFANFVGFGEYDQKLKKRSAKMIPKMEPSGANLEPGCL